MPEVLRLKLTRRALLVGRHQPCILFPISGKSTPGLWFTRTTPSRFMSIRRIRGKKFNVTLKGKDVFSVTGEAKTKLVPELKYTGQSLQRDDIPGKVDGSLKWAVDVRPPGMVHARNVKPPFACAKLTGIDESAVKSLPGFIKVMSKGNYVAVVCEREEQAIRAARQLKTTWQKPSTAPFPASEDLFNYMRSAPPASAGRPAGTGDAETR